MRAAILSVFLAFSWISAGASEALVKTGIVLLQPNFVLKDRVPDVAVLADYINSVENAGRAALAQNRQRFATGGFIVVAVQPSLKSNVWLDFSPPLPTGEKELLITKIRSVIPFEARNGPVVFAIQASVWGGSLPKQGMPSPIEWKDAAKKSGRPLEVDEIIKKTWSE